MSAEFLSNFMQFSLQTTGADRGLACDTELSIIAQANLDQVDVMDEKFTGFETMRRAFTEGAPVITNNAVMDASLAPQTNTNFSNLRVVVVIPLMNCGAIYLDQPIRRGIISKIIVNKLFTLGNHILENDQLDISEEGLSQLYAQMNG